MSKLHLLPWEAIDTERDGRCIVDANGFRVMSECLGLTESEPEAYMLRAVNYHDQLRQCIRDLLLCIQVPADAPAYAAAVKLLNETEEPKP